MTIGIFQLQARGEQDEFLIGNPEVSFFKSVYRRHTNFSIQTEELIFNNVVDWGKYSECIIQRKGDLVARMYLRFKIPRLSDDRSNQSSQWVSNIGHAMIKFVEIEIGGQRIDIHTGESLYCTNQLSGGGSKRNGLDFMIGYEVEPQEERNIFIPLDFWFNKADSAFLPIIALDMHEVKIKLQLREFEEITIGNADYVPLEDVSVITDYIYLDIDERKRIQTTKRRYLIDQTQINIENKTDRLINTVDLMFKNNVKEIYWMVRNVVQGDVGESDAKDWFNYSYKNNANPIKNVTLRINGQDKFKQLSGEYFNLVQPFQHHSNIPENTGLCVYSFALNPETHQPSGTFNFSCVDNAQLIIELHDDYFLDLESNDLDGEQEVSIQVYALSYNILEIGDGKAKLLFD